MARKLKCRWCQITDSTKEEMEVERVGKQNRYFHKDCFRKYLEDKKFKEKERKELDKLIETIKEVYGVKRIPNSIYPYLQDLRNGTELFGKRNYKYKKGYTYDLIAQTFVYCSETIRYWCTRKSFSSFMGAFKYGLAIVQDKLPIVEKRRQQQKNIEERIKQFEDRQCIEFASNYKKPSRDNDISQFLDD